MKILVSGSSGLLGSALVPVLQRDGHAVVRLLRSRPAPGSADVQWDPAGGSLDAAALRGVEAAVHLSGEGIAEKRWTEAQKAEVLSSRVASTALLSKALASLDPKPAVLVSSSAVGYYGADRGDEELTEESSTGAGFLADVCRQWEAAAGAAESAGVRVVRLRTGVVLSPNGGALKAQLPFFRLGLGGRLGSGRQWLPWIALDDQVGAIRHALATEGISGPLNASAPHPARNAEFTRVLARVLKRPAVLPVPKAALALRLGRELAEEVALANQRMLPAKLQASGYSFRFPELEGALRHLLGQG